MKYLGLDIGDVRIGIAISVSGILASPLSTQIRGGGLKSDAEKLMKIIRDYAIDTVVVGKPIHLDGREHIQAKKNEMLVELLRAEGIKIDYWDERFSSAAAEKAMLEGDVSRKKRKQNIDKLAAVIILQNYLDSLG